MLDPQITQILGICQACVFQGGGAVIESEVHHYFLPQTSSIKGICHEGTKKD